MEGKSAEKDRRFESETPSKDGARAGRDSQPREPQKTWRYSNSTPRSSPSQKKAAEFNRSGKIGAVGAQSLPSSAIRQSCVVDTANTAPLNLGSPHAPFRAGQELLAFEQVDIEHRGRGRICGDYLTMPAVQEQHTPRLCVCDSHIAVVKPLERVKLRGEMSGDS